MAAPGLIFTLVYPFEIPIKCSKRWQTSSKNIVILKTVATGKTLMRCSGGWRVTAIGSLTLLTHPY